MEQVRKVELAYHLTKNTYNRKVLLHRGKVRYLDTVIKSACIFVGETLDTIGKYGLEDIKKRDRKTFRQIVGQKMKDGEIRLRPN